MQDKYDFEQEKKTEESPSVDEGTVDSTEEGFMKGYMDEGNVEECEECGSAVDKEHKELREIDGETHLFCSKTCAEEFEESLGSSE